MNLLFREDSKKEVVTLKPEAVKDLALMEIVESAGDSEKSRLILKSIFTKLPSDIDDISYRQDIMRDLLENSELSDELEEVLGQIQILKDYSKSKPLIMQNDQVLYTLLERLRELSTYVHVSESIFSSLEKHSPGSEGLKLLREKLAGVVKDEKFEQTKQDIEKMLGDLSNVKGALVGVNFTPDLNVESVAAIEFVPYKLRSKYMFAEIVASINSIIGYATSSNSLRGPYSEVRIPDPMLVNLTPQIEKHLKRHFSDIKSTMNKHLKLDASFITDMYEALTFYILMAKFGRRIKSEGNEICFPELNGQEKGVSFKMKDMYNIRLVLSKEERIVKNDFSFSPEENLFILTGPNRGGKTIMEQALGIISVMTSIGCFVTASECTGRPFSNILTHFPIDENLTINYGRLGEEAVRIREIIKESDDKTLLLCNETYSTTSAVDGLYLSRDLLHVMKDIGTAVIFNTHIHEVARSIPEMNEWEGGSRFVSLVMEIKDDVNTFRIKRCDPDSKSYAMNIARKYGITYEQISQIAGNK
ncbi:MAG: hypothetical protein J5842_02170 [Lachnospiraceae bacterium]|nr:hypothetical protein [Lachnospiraceae bacterium]